MITPKNVSFETRRSWAVLIIAALVIVPIAGCIGLGVAVNAWFGPSRHSTGPNRSVDVALYLEADATDAQIGELQRQFQTKREGTDGYDLLDGIVYMGGDFENRAVYLDFVKRASGDDRSEVLRIARESDLVETIAFDRRPSAGRP